MDSISGIFSQILEKREVLSTQKLARLRRSASDGMPSLVVARSPPKLVLLLVILLAA